MDCSRNCPGVAIYNSGQKISINGRLIGGTSCRVRTLPPSLKIRAINAVLVSGVEDGSRWAVAVGFRGNDGTHLFLAVDITMIPDLTNVDVWLGNLKSSMPIFGPCLTVPGIITTIVFI